MRGFCCFEQRIADIVRGKWRIRDLYRLCCTKQCTELLMAFYKAYNIYLFQIKAIY